MKERLVVILFMIILIMPLAFAGITGSTADVGDEKMLEDEECYSDCEEEFSNNGISVQEVDSESNSITGKATDENNSKGFFEKLIDWIKGLFS